MHSQQCTAVSPSSQGTCKARSRSEGCPALSAGHAGKTQAGRAAGGSRDASSTQQRLGNDSSLEQPAEEAFRCDPAVSRSPLGKAADPPLPGEHAGASPCASRGSSTLADGFELRSSLVRSDSEASLAGGGGSCASPDSPDDRSMVSGPLNRLAALGAEARLADGRALGEGPGGVLSLPCWGI